MAIQRQFQRRATTAEWTEVNPVIGDGEIAFDKTDGTFRIGDGVAPWADLVRFVPETEAPPVDLTGVPLLLIYDDATGWPTFPVGRPIIAVGGTVDDPPPSGVVWLKDAT